MGCTACSEICGSDNQGKRNGSQFLKIVQNKVLFIKKIFLNPKEKFSLDGYFTDEELDIIMRLVSIQQSLSPQNILLPEAGELTYLTPVRRTIWKLFTFQYFVFQYNKSELVHKFVQDFSDVKMKEQTQQRFYQIGLDIKRTFPTTTHLNRDQLDIVLKNLTLYFDGVGYTQGMNFVVGFLLLCGFNPKQTYFMFISLSLNKNFLLIRNFNEGFKNVMFMIKIFQSYMDKHQKLKAIKQKVDEMGLTSYFYSFSWFLCYFLYSLEPKSCVLIWDHILTFYQFQNTPTSDKNSQNKQQNKIMQKIAEEDKCLKNKQFYPQYLQIIENKSGNILNILYLSFQIMNYLGDKISQSQSPQQLMGVLRNQSLIQNITPEVVNTMLNSLRKGQNNFKDLNKHTLLKQIQKQDTQLYQIHSTQKGYKKFVEEVLGLRRLQSQNLNRSKQQINKN